MMLQPGVICPAVCFYDAGGYTLTIFSYICSDTKRPSVRMMLTSFYHEKRDF